VGSSFFFFFSSFPRLATLHTYIFEGAVASIVCSRLGLYGKSILEILAVRCEELLSVIVSMTTMNPERGMLDLVNDFPPSHTIFLHLLS
jgi:hypothetical protein